MLIKAIKLIFFILCVVGVILAVYIFKSLMPKSELINTYSKDDIHIEIPQEKRWFNDFKSTHQNFAYPATEVEFSINFVQDGYKNQKDRIVIPNVDEEAFFCIREVLKKEQIRFAYKKTSDTLDIILYLQDEQKDHLLEIFDYYGIKYSRN